MDAILKVAIAAADKAGDWIVYHHRAIDALNIEEKQARDYVSEVDKGAEERIINTILAAFPEDGIKGEEGGDLNPQSAVQWIIDPLDGTTNFLHGFGHYAVSIGRLENQQLTHAVVFDPLKKECFTAIAGQGAFLNGRPISVSQRQDLNSSLIATGFPFKEFAHKATYTCQMHQLMRRTAGLRRAGSAALDLAYVACGRMDAYWEYYLHPWDIAGGVLLVREAGGYAASVRGKEDCLNSGHILATNGKITPILQQILWNCEDQYQEIPQSSTP